MSAAVAQGLGEQWWWLIVVINGVLLAMGVGIWWLARRVDNKHFLLALGGGLAAILFIAVMIALAAGTALLQFDITLTTALSRSLSIDALRFWLPVTHLGDGFTRTLLGIGVAAMLLHRRRRTLALIWSIALIGSGVWSRGLKAVFERVRPTRAHDLITELSWSFPSGHACGAMVTYGMLGFILCRVAPPTWHAVIVIIATIAIANIGLSRVLLQVHFFSDVLAGFALGAAWLAACIGALMWFERQHGE